MANAAGRHEEGMELLRNALVAAELNELDNPEYELDALKTLIYALFKTNVFDEVEPLLLRYREVAKTHSEKEGFGFAECYILLGYALLHEVLCLCTPRLGITYHISVFFFQHGHIASDCHRFHCARAKTHAPVELCALCRHAGRLKRLRGRYALCST